MEEAYSVGTDGAEVGFETFATFVEKFKKAFEPLSPVQDAITKLKALRQTGLAEDYVAAFRPLAARSGIAELAVLSDYFLSGLSRGSGQIGSILRNTPRLHGRVLRIGSPARPPVEKGQQVLLRNQGFIVFLRQDNYYANSAHSSSQAH